MEIIYLEKVINFIDSLDLKTAQPFDFIQRLATALGLKLSITVR
jgi:hypothetical protein